MFDRFRKSNDKDSSDKKGKGKAMPKPAPNVLKKKNPAGGIIPARDARPASGMSSASDSSSASGSSPASGRAAASGTSSARERPAAIYLSSANAMVPASDMSHVPEENLRSSDAEDDYRAQNLSYTWSDEDYAKPPSRSGLSGQPGKRKELLEEAGWRKVPREKRLPSPDAAMATPYAARTPLPQHLQEEPDLAPVRELIKEIERSQSPRGDKAVFFDPNSLSPALKKKWDKHAGQGGGGRI